MQVSDSIATAFENSNSPVSSMILFLIDLYQYVPKNDHAKYIGKKAKFIIRIVTCMELSYSKVFKSILRMRTRLKSMSSQTWIGYSHD